MPMSTLRAMQRVSGGVQVRAMLDKSHWPYKSVPLGCVLVLIWPNSPICEKDGTYISEDVVVKVCSIARCASPRRHGNSITLKRHVCTHCCVLGSSAAVGGLVGCRASRGSSSRAVREETCLGLLFYLVKHLQPTAVARASPWLREMLLRGTRFRARTALVVFVVPQADPN